MLSLSLCGIASGQEQTAAIETQGSSSSSQKTKDTCHFELSPSLWFAGAHGTVGALGRTASVHASVGDLLSHANFGVIGGAEARCDNLLLTGELLWVRLSDSSAQPFPGLNATSADVRVGQLVWTSKLGYRVIDDEKLKIDANVGARFWHLGQRLNFTPSTLGLNLETSQYWADVVIGGRVELPVGAKTTVVALGDVGGWNASANLDYQFAGLLTYRIRSKWTATAGYRYLFVDYHSGRSVYTVVTSGALLGITYRFK